jgi:hypothetical protein
MPRTLIDYLNTPGADEVPLEEALLDLGLASADQGDLADTAVQPPEIPGRIASAFTSDGSGTLANALSVLLNSAAGGNRDALRVAIQAILDEAPPPVIPGRPIGLLLTLTRIN